jgi:hypothetical protein
MNWEQEVYIDHNRVKNNMDKGYRYLVNERSPQPYDVDSDLDDYLYSLLVDELDVKSYYHVGFNMGRTLISVSRLLPKMRVGGITWFDASAAFGQQLFNLADHNFEIQIGEYPYKPIIGSWDFINLGRLPDKSNLGVQILGQAFRDSVKYVFFFASPGQTFQIPDHYECVQNFDSELQYIPTLLKCTIHGKGANHIIVDEAVGDIEVELEDSGSDVKIGLPPGFIDSSIKAVDIKPIDLDALDEAGLAHDFNRGDFEFGAGATPNYENEPEKDSDPLVNDGAIEEELKEFFNKETESHDIDGK